MNYPLLALAVLSLSLSACTGWENGMNGKLNILPGKKLVVNDTDRGRVSFVSGNVSIAFEYGVIGITNPSVVISRSEGDEVEISLPRKEFSDKSLVVSAAEMKQSFNLKASQVKRLIKKWKDTEDNVPCTYSGYCSHLETKTTQTGTDSNGNATYTTTSSLEYGYYYACDGHHDEEREYSQFRYGYDMYFYDLSNKLIGSFSGNGEKEWQEYRVLDETSCH